MQLLYDTALEAVHACKRKHEQVPAGDVDARANAMLSVCRAQFWFHAVSVFQQHIDDVGLYMGLLLETINLFPDDALCQKQYSNACAVHRLVVFID